MSIIKQNLGIEIRKEVLAASLQIEGMSSSFLAVFLGIKNYTNSRILGNNRSSLSFNQKIDLLIEIGVLSPDKRAKFQCFMEIRNQFVHNVSATSYENCFKETKGKAKYILDTYPQSKSEENEKRLEKATRALIIDIQKIMTCLVLDVKNKLKKEAEIEMLKLTQKAQTRAMKEIKFLLDELIEQERHDSISTSKLKKIGTRISKKFYSLSMKYIKSEI